MYECMTLKNVSEDAHVVRFPKDAKSGKVSGMSSMYAVSSEMPLAHLAI